MNSLPLVPTVVACAAAVFVCGASLSCADEIAVGDLTNLPPADVVILGEVHDNPAHHLAQAEAVRSINPKAIVFEMLSDAQARRIRPDTPRDLRGLDDLLGWTETGWPSFAFYFPIFEAAGDVPIYGAWVNLATIIAATEDGAGAVFGDAASIFGLDSPLDDREQSIREARQQTSHCNALPRDMLAGMVEAQRLRDAYLARATLAAYLDTGGPVVVITGNGHARKDWGIPAMLDISHPDLRVLTIGQFERAAHDTHAFDLWLVTEAAERADPCAVFDNE